MKRLMLMGVLAAIVAVPAVAALKQGDMAPDFNAQASFGGKSVTVSLKETLKKGTVVIYFYPSAYTFGCNIQAHDFAVNSDKFAAAGATIVGVSLDDLKRLNEFSADPQFCAGKFATVSDPDAKITKMYDLMVMAAKTGMKDSRGVEIGHDFAERTTFVVTPDGKIAETIGGVDAADNVAKALQAVQRLKAHK